jgi:predicted esterase
MEPSVPFGAELDEASAAVILIHGRDRSPGEMIELAKRLDVPGLAWRAPAAAGGSWYPQRFMAPVEANQPQLDEALARIDHEVRLLRAAGFGREQIVLLGFSQGACLAAEYVYRHPARWAGLIAFTGGLIGPEGTAWDRRGRLDETPVLLTAGDPDDWVPWSRMEETAAVFRAMGGRVSLTSYPGRDHLVCDDDIAAGRELLASCA